LKRPRTSRLFLVGAAAAALLVMLDGSVGFIEKTLLVVILFLVAAVVFALTERRDD
jgi:Ca2+/Na+ antiporter